MNQRFNKQQQAISKFVEALDNSNMQPSYGSEEDTPKYYRGFIDKSNIDQAIFLRFVVDENEIPYSSDDLDFMQTTEIGGEIYTTNGFDDSDYIALCNEIEAQMQINKINFQWLGEETNVNFDIDNPISFKRFNATINNL